MRVLLFVFALLAFVPAAYSEEIYICPMHPHIEGEAGETCPICGMTLVPKVVDAPPMEGMDAGADDKMSGMVSITPQFIQALGVKTAEVKQVPFGRDVKAFGEIVPSSRNQTVVNMRAPGWIVKLATDAVGDTVAKGDLLFTYYSPELMSAQSDYLIGKRGGVPVENLERRLRLYGMDEKAIADFKAAGAMMEETPFYAPVAGTVVSLNISEGSYLNPGEQALAMQDFAQVWVNADVPVRDVAFLREGQKAMVHVPETGKHYESTIDFIHHVADLETRTATVRLELPHSHGEPKPGYLVDVTFMTDAMPRLAVPAEAVLYDGRGAHLIKSLGIQSTPQGIRTF
ncbi:MAG: efflux RND transporter periplasmic adaptor subunit, partial [Paracoccaceae bacterium]